MANVKTSSNSSTPSNSRFSAGFQQNATADDGGFNTLVAMSIAKDVAITALAGAACYKILTSGKDEK